MQTKQKGISYILILITHLFLSANVFAQTADSTNLNMQKQLQASEFNHLPASFFYKSTKFNQLLFSDSIAPFMKLYRLYFPSGVESIFLDLSLVKGNKGYLFPNLSEGVSFEQERKDGIFPNFGEYLYFKNSFAYNVKNGIAFDVGIGLVKQNSVLSSWHPNYQFVFNTSLGYAVTPWLGTYVFGQYVTRSINNPKFFDPLQYMNPLFLQTEFGGGLKVKYKNIKADIGGKIMYDTQFKKVDPVGRMNSKMTIGF